MYVYVRREFSVGFITRHSRLPRASELCFRNSKYITQFFISTYFKSFRLFKIIELYACFLWTTLMELIQKDHTGNMLEWLRISCNTSLRIWLWKIILNLIKTTKNSETLKDHTGNKQSKNFCFNDSLFLWKFLVRVYSIKTKRISVNLLENMKFSSSHFA